MADTDKSGDVTKYSAEALARKHGITVEEAQALLDKAIMLAERSGITPANDDSEP